MTNAGKSKFSISPNDQISALAFPDKTSTRRRVFGMLLANIKFAPEHDQSQTEKLLNLLIDDMAMTARIAFKAGVKHGQKQEQRTRKRVVDSLADRPTRKPQTKLHNDDAPKKTVQRRRPARPARPSRPKKKQPGEQTTHPGLFS